MTYDAAMTVTDRKPDFKLTTNIRASYGVFIMKILKKIDHVKTAPHCIYWVASLK